MTQKQILYLSRNDVESIRIDMNMVVQQLEIAFKEKGKGHVEMPIKYGIHPQTDAFIHAMPAYIPLLRTAGLKWVSAFPGNTKRGLPYINGLIILNEEETGIPYAVMDCTCITAYRTGAATALSAKYLANKNSEIVGILACGVQGRVNLLALASMFSIKRVYAYDLQLDVQRKYVEEMSIETGIEIIGVENPKDAVTDSDLVVTSGPILKHPTPTIEKDWLRPGAFASAVDYDSYWMPEALEQIEKISTDDSSQFQYYRTNGYFQATPYPYADLGEIVAGIKPGREKDNERTMSMNLGVAMDDMAVAPEIYRRAKECGIGTFLEL